MITNGCTVPDAKQPIVTGEAAGRDHVTSLLRILAGLRMKTVKDFRNLLEEVSSGILDSDLVLNKAYLTEHIRRLADRIAHEGNDVHVILLHTVYEKDSEPRHADLYILSDSARLVSE